MASRMRADIKVGDVRCSRDCLAWRRAEGAMTKHSGEAECSSFSLHLQNLAACPC